MATWSNFSVTDRVVPRARALIPAIADQLVVVVGVALVAAAYLDWIVRASSGTPIFYVVALLCVALLARQRATIVKLRREHRAVTDELVIQLAADDDPKKLRA